MPRPPLSTALAILAGVLVTLAGVAHYTRDQLLDERAFAARAATALEDEAVRSVVAERIVDTLVESASAEVLTVRPLLVSAIEALIGTAPFERLFALAARDAHRALIRGEPSVILDLDRAGALLIDGLRSVSPEIARNLPRDAEPVLAELDPRSLELEGARTVSLLARLWWLWSLLAVAAAVGAVVVAHERRRGLGRVAAATAAGAAVVAAGVTIGGAVVARHAARAADLEDDRERDAVLAVWNALAGDLRTVALLACAASLAVAAVSAGIVTPSDLRAALRRGQALMGARTRPVRAARGGAAIVAGATLIVAPEIALEVAVIGIGGLLVFLGVTEVAGALEGVRSGRRRHQARLARRPLATGAAAVATVAVGALVTVLIVRAPALPGADDTPAGSEGCNGSPALCARRLNEIVIPATHNSFSAAQDPGWLFANQRYGIQRQLEDGIRGFLIDVHPGVRDPATGRVRTDLAPGEESRNRVARELSPDALATADRLAGGVGLGQLTGRRRPYLCHSLCELGAEPLDEELASLRAFLERSRGEVVVLFVEPYVPVASIESSLRDAGLLDDVAELRRDAPLPTLGELVVSGRRIVVLTERGGGSRPWYLPGFSFAQDTPLGARTPSELRCDRNRGDADSPLLLVNHWIDDFPPSPTANERIGRAAFLERRVRRCLRVRGFEGALVAVDHYDRGDVVEVARRLNARR